MPGGVAAAAANLPPECKEFTATMEQLMACDKLPIDARTQMGDGYQKMLDAMIKLDDKKASIDGCKQGQDGLKQALASSGC